MERVNVVIKQYIWIYTLYLQDDWINWLIFAEFIVNNFVLETTKVSLFLANYGQYFWMGFEPLNNTLCPAHHTPQVTKANRFVKKMEKLQQFLTDEITWAQSIYKATVNKNCTPTPAYQIGDFV